MPVLAGYFAALVLCCSSGLAGHSRSLTTSMWSPFRLASVLSWFTSFQRSMFQQHSVFPGLENWIFSHWTARSVSFCLRWLAIKSLMESTWFLSKGCILFWMWVGKCITYEYNENVLQQLACQASNCCWIDHRSSLLYLTQHKLSVWNIKAHEGLCWV